MVYRNKQFLQRAFRQIKSFTCFFFYDESTFKVFKKDYEIQNIHLINGIMTLLKALNTINSFKQKH